MVDLDALRSWYDDLVRGTPSLGEEGCAEFADRQLALGAAFGSRPLCRVLRPELITRSQLRNLQDSCIQVADAVRGTLARTLEDLESPSLDLSPGALDLMKIDPGFRKLGITARLDGFASGDGISFVELNAEAPAGIAYHDSLAEIFAELPPMRELASRVRLRPLRAVGRLLAGLLTT